MRTIARLRAAHRLACRFDAKGGRRGSFAEFALRGIEPVRPSACACVMPHRREIPAIYAP
ncbi:hypothetical protein San01_59900 [Streptomyces angustmyceticus]|uniref:Uncharacterized protein n=1 Tax=Streptomyces angustmyceticus TaxID=285578 RepID=A0A5J4LNE0_9ACTN|nr:hypothetical protein San01_59900 [Streptomyces angustmyceticus]